ncbi:MAG TPA: hypothetical protein VLH38_02865 [Patescibacteria group bacterium]|nr:hypothetical protein [Patescibacteria group bacterium]
MNHNLALLIALALPAIVFAVLRVNASLVFLSLCLGTVLVQYVASEADQLIHLASAHASPIGTSTMKLALLVAPAAITSVVTVFSIRGRIKTMINFLPSLSAGALLILLVVPLLPPGLRNNLQGQQVWHYLSNAESLVVAAGATVSLSLLWTQRSLFQHGERRRR